MSGYASDFFYNFITYFNAFFENELIKYFCSIFIVLSVIGILRKLLKVTS